MKSKLKARNFQKRHSQAKPRKKQAGGHHSPSALPLSQRGPLQAVTPPSAAAYTKLGWVHYDRHDFPAAEDAFRRALTLGADHVPALKGLALTLQHRNKHEEPKLVYQKLLALCPKDIEVWERYQAILREEGLYGQAELWLQRALDVRPHFLDGLLQMAVLYWYQGRLGDAHRYIDKALSLRPDLGDAHHMRAELWLMAGDFSRGWPEFERRLRIPAIQASFPAPPFQPATRWRGERLAGQSLHVVPEGGFGDILMFLRFAAQLQDRSGARVVLGCKPELRRLLSYQASPGWEELAEESPAQFAAWVSLQSLPHLYALNEDTLLRDYSAPYLTVPEEFTRLWARRLPQTQNLKVGLVWAGGNRTSHDARRSCSLQDMAPLARTPGVEFFSLQIGPASSEAQHPPTGMVLHDLTGDIKDFLDTAALIQNLDLVISVDTSTAHLAGAVGKPVWIALPAVPEWRWQLNREDSPWYPSAKLFRQSKLHDWQPVFARVATELRALAEARPVAEVQPRVAARKPRSHYFSAGDFLRVLGLGTLSR